MRTVYVAGLCVLALAGCGRYLFEPTPTDENESEAGQPSYFMSPTGDDNNAGTRDAPWRTFSQSLARLVPGDRLTLLDGDYDGRTDIGTLHVDCAASSKTCAGGPCARGTPDAPIVIAADNERGAHLFGTQKGIQIDYCTDWQFDGFFVEGIDDPTMPVGIPSVVAIDYSMRIAVRNLLVTHPNRYFNSYGIHAYLSSAIDIEDSEVFGFHRGAITTNQSRGVNIRRCYTNGGGYPDITGGYRSACVAGGDYSVVSYYSEATLVENVVSEDACEAFVVITGADMPTANNGWGKGNIITDSIAIGPGIYGFAIISDCDGTTAKRCDAGPDRVATMNTIANSVAIGYSTQFLARGVGNVITGVTALGIIQRGIVLEPLAATGGVAATGYVHNALVVNAREGVIQSLHADWAVTDTDVFQAITPFTPYDSHVTGALTMDPQLGSCVAYLPQTSPMLTTASGEPIGADIRSVWTPVTGAFPCGAVVAGANDVTAASCANVHRRLNIGVNGCEPP